MSSQHHERLAVKETPKWLRRVSCLEGKTKPEHVHWRRRLDRLKSRQFAQAREASISAHGQHSSYFMIPIDAMITHTAHFAILFDKLIYLRAHYALKCGITPRFIDNKIQEGRLRDKRDIGVLYLQY